MGGEFGGEHWRRAGPARPPVPPRKPSVLRLESRRARRPARPAAPPPSLPGSAAARLEALHRQAGALAHDFNNLLGVIVGASETLSAGLAEGSEGKRLAEASLEAAELGAVLLRRLLDLAHEAPPAPIAADCAGAIETAARFARHALPRSVEVAVAPMAEPLACAADAADLESALLNLCINAGDAMASRVEIAAERLVLPGEAAADLGLSPGAYVRIEVRDDGTGMSPETLARATEPFFTTKRRRGGAGLGLSGVDDFARRSGGRLVLTSERGVGSSAVLYLPRAIGPG